MEKGSMRYKVPGGSAEAVFADPGGDAPAVLVLHEVWGLTPFIEKVCGRLAEEGFAAYAPVLYWRDRALFSPERIRAAIRAVWDLPLPERYDRRKMDSAIRRSKSQAEVGVLLTTLYDPSFRSLLARDIRSLARYVSGDAKKVGVMGFSMGGALAFRLASEFGRVKACVTFSAEPPAPRSLAEISSPILSFYGSDDAFMTQRVPEFARDSLRLGKRLTLNVFPAAGHEFFDSDGRSGYRRAAAEESWRESIDFLAKLLQ